MKIDIKPLSVNEAWQGKRFKTPKYQAYELELLLRLGSLNVGKGKLRVYINVGYSNAQSDIDNCVKPFLDILQKKYGFNDSQIYELNIRKIITEKGKEFIEFVIHEEKER